MLSKAPSKAELSRMLQDKCEHALLLDNTISTTYAAQPAPSKGKYRQRKAQPDAFQLEIERLRQAKSEQPTTRPETNSDPASDREPPTVDIDLLEQEVAEFMKSRRRK